MTTAAEFNRNLRVVLRRHILKDSSVFQTAKELGISHSALGQLLSGQSDTGLGRSLDLAEKAGLPPIRWMLETGLFSDNCCSQLLRTTLELDQPTDPLVKRCFKLLQRCSADFCQPMDLPQVVLEIDDLFHHDPVGATSSATLRLESSLKALRSALRRRVRPSQDDWTEFICLIASYAIHGFSRTHPKEAAIGIAIALEQLEQAGPSPILTWLMIDASLMLRRLFMPDKALDLAEAAVAKAVSQDVRRLYPRALLALASIQFYMGASPKAVDTYGLILNLRSSNPYQPIAAYSMACALADADPSKALESLATYGPVLDELPPYRQIQRHWTAGRAFAKAGAKEDACVSLTKALEIDAQGSDIRDLFLIFEELRQIIGSKDRRLLPLAKNLRVRLPELTFNFPEEFLAADQYLGYLKDLNERRLGETIGLIRERRRPKCAG